MNHLSVGLDVDDVLLPSAEHTIRWYNRHFNTDLTTKNWYRNFPLEVWKARSEEEIIERVNGILNSEDYISEIVPMEGALEVLDAMDKAGDERFGVTSRPGYLAEMTHRALELCYPGMFPEGSITFINHSTASDAINTLTKVEIALEHHATHFGDDFEHHLRPMAAVGIKPLLFGEDYSWNEDADASGMQRIPSWRVFGEVLARDRRI
jgi:hypothetical protein